MNTIPDDPLSVVFKYLDIYSLHRMMLTCKGFDYTFVIPCITSFEQLFESLDSHNRYLEGILDPAMESLYTFRDYCTGITSCELDIPLFKYGEGMGGSYAPWDLDPDNPTMPVWAARLQQLIELRAPHLKHVAIPVFLCATPIAGETSRLNAAIIETFAGTGVETLCFLNEEMPNLKKFSVYWESGEAEDIMGTLTNQLRPQLEEVVFNASPEFGFGRGMPLDILNWIADCAKCSPKLNRVSIVSVDDSVSDGGGEKWQLWAALLGIDINNPPSYSTLSQVEDGCRKNTTLSMSSFTIGGQNFWQFIHSFWPHQHLTLQLSDLMKIWTDCKMDLVDVGTIASYMHDRLEGTPAADSVPSWHINFVLEKIQERLNLNHLVMSQTLEIILLCRHVAGNQWTSERLRHLERYHQIQGDGTYHALCIAKSILSGKSPFEFLIDAVAAALVSSDLRSKSVKALLGLCEMREFVSLPFRSAEREHAFFETLRLDFELALTLVKFESFNMSAQSPLSRASFAESVLDRLSPCVSQTMFWRSGKDQRMFCDIMRAKMPTETGILQRVQVLEQALEKYQRK